MLLANGDMRLGFIYLGGDDPKKNTARKLERLNMAIRVRYRPGLSWIVLDPHSDRYLIPSDREKAERKGILVPDCSWREIERLSKLKFRETRKLPPLLPANPVKYGQASILSTAESFAASLYILGDISKAEEILSKFKWGPNFLILNRLPLEEYSHANSSEQIQEIADSYF